MLAAQKRVFTSIFPTSSAATTVPTPVATPVLGSTGEGQSFGGPQIPLSPDLSSPSDIGAEHIKWNRAWHIATSFLKLPEEQITYVHANLDENQLRGHWMKEGNTEVSRAVSYLFSSPGTHHQDGDLVAWYTNDVRRHFLAYVRPVVTQVRASTTIQLQIYRTDGDVVSSKGRGSWYRSHDISTHVASGSGNLSLSSTQLASLYDRECCEDRVKVSW